jgi:hypothetical protein
VCLVECFACMRREEECNGMCEQGLLFFFDGFLGCEKKF